GVGREAVEEEVAERPLVDLAKRRRSRHRGGLLVPEERSQPVLTAVEIDAGEEGRRDRIAGRAAPGKTVLDRGRDVRPRQAQDRTDGCKPARRDRGRTRR